MKKIYIRLLWIGGILFLGNTANIFAQEDLNFDLPDISVFDTPTATPSDTLKTPDSTPQNATIPTQQAVEIPVQNAAPVAEPQLGNTDTLVPSVETNISEPTIQTSPVVESIPVIEPQPKAVSQSVSQPISSYPSVSQKPWIKRGWGVNASFGSNLFYGDLRIYELWPAKQYNNERKWAGSIMLEKELVSYLDFRGQLLYGKLSGTKRNYSNGTPANMYFDATTFEYSTNFKFNLTNAIIGREAPLSLYAYAGIGFVNFRTTRKDLRNDAVLEWYGYDGTTKHAPTIETMVPIGLGIDFKATENLYFDLDVSMRVVNTDKLDANISPGSEFFQDMYGYTSIGVTYKFGNRTSYVPPVTISEPIVEQVAVVPVDTVAIPVIDSVASIVVDTTMNVTETFQIPTVQEENPVVEAPILEQSPIVEKVNQNTDNGVTTIDGVSYKNVTSEQGLVYRIQIIAVQKQKDSKILQLKKMYNLNEIIYEEKIDTWYKYTLGSFATVQEALKYREQLVNKGIKDAFIVPYYQGTRITNQQARDLQSK